MNTTPQTLEGARQQLEAVQKTIHLSQTKIEALLQEVRGLKKDEKTLTQALIEAARKERMDSDKIGETTRSLQGLLAQKKQIEKKIQGKRADLAQILAALERMGLQPPPAMLAGPDDVVTSLRSAVLLGTLLQKMHQTAHQLSQILQRVTQLAATIQKQQQNLYQEISLQKEQKRKLELLLVEKQKLVQTSQQGLQKERIENEKLAQQAKSLQSLIDTLNRKSQEDPKDSALFEAARKRLLSSPPFPTLKHKLHMPASGHIVHVYKKDKDDPLQGTLLATTPEAVVTAPADGVVVYSGRFRSYGKLIILEVGQGYYMLVAGLAKVNVERGAFVLKDEPIGRMPEKGIAPALNIALNSDAPILYVAFRKQEKPINPEDWWVDDAAERNLNDP